MHQLQPAHRGSPAFELVRGEIDALPEQSTEGALHAIAADELLQIPVLAAREVQELAIGVPGVRVDDPTGQGEEAGLPLREPSAKDSARLVQADRVPQEGREADQEPRAGESIPQRVRAERLHPFNLPGTIGHPSMGHK